MVEATLQQPWGITLLALFSSFFAIAYAISLINAIRKKHVLRACRKGVGTLTLSSMAFLVWFFIFGFYGFQVLTKEQLVARLIIEPLQADQFYATLEPIGGESERFLLSGDQVQIDAEIVKWHRWANIIGIHTYYELDRISGRFKDVKQNAHSRYNLGKPQVINVAKIRESYPWLGTLYDTSYGSSSYIDATQANCFHVLVSTTGILLRDVSCG